MNQVCQSCGMPLNEKHLFSRNVDGSLNSDYCKYCYQDGGFVNPNETMEEMIETCIPFMKEHGMNEEEARELMKATLPKLSRWRIKESVNENRILD